MEKKVIRLIIFNECFWDKGLVYSQNILPLIKLIGNAKKYKVEIIFYVSILDFIKSNKKIKSFKSELKKVGIRVIYLQILFVRSKLFALRWYMLIYLILNTFPYLIWFSLKDLLNNRENIYYHLRSYAPAFLFTLMYFGKAKLIFDPRSDFNVENIRIGSWKKDSFSDYLWKKIEHKIVNKSFKTIFISTPLRADILERNEVRINPDKHFLFYNSIDFRNFENAFVENRTTDRVKFLYTGSLGNWNNINTYLEFFLEIKKYLTDSTLTIITGTKKSKINASINDDKYKNIINDVYIYTNIPYEKLSDYYKNCSVGLQLMTESDSRIGVKFVEYLAAGLVPIVNTNVRGAAYFCRSELGILLNEQKTKDYKLISREILRLLNSNYKNHILVIKDQFDINSSYNLLNEIYSS